MKVKIKFLEDRVKVLDKAVGRINQILGRFQMTEATGFKDMDTSDKFRDADTMEREHELI